MVYLYRIVEGYLKENFNSRLYIATLIWVAFLLSFNYYYDFEDSYIDSFYGSNIRVLLMFAFQAISYYVSCWFVYLFTNTKDFISSFQFWGISLFGFLVLSFDRGNAYSQDIAHLLSDHVHTFLFTFKMVLRWMPLFTMVLPLALFYYIIQKSTINHFYGLRRGNINLKPYFIILMIMVPIIILASFNPSFLKQYPNFRSAGITNFCDYLNLESSWVTALYEISYAFGFFTVELFFRGFLIFGLVRFLGAQVILPMTVVYCVLHFGKPLGEAVSSIFGGYILGILALKTNNIYGGIIVHIGIAWLMELFAYIQLQ